MLRLQPALSQVNKRARPPSAAIVLQLSAIPARAIHPPNISIRLKSQSHRQIYHPHRLEHGAEPPKMGLPYVITPQRGRQQSQPDHARASIKLSLTRDAA
jgi:hypothetical protein